MSQIREFTILQFNTWLMAFPFLAYSRDYAERRRLLPDALLTQNADVLCLQEVWRNGDKTFLERELRKRGYSHFLFTRHIFGMGDGIFIASRHPIVRLKIGSRFRIQTQFLEWFSAKRVIAAVIAVTGIGEIEIYQTHLGAALFNIKDGTHDIPTRKRLAQQLQEVSEFVRTNRTSKFAFVAGDFNLHYQEYEGDHRRHSPHYSGEYNSFMASLCGGDVQFENSFLVGNQMDASHPAVATYSQKNRYVSDGEFANYPEETLDYVLYTASPELRVIESKIVFHDFVSERAVSLSDHYGIRSVFQFTT